MKPKGAAMWTETELLDVARHRQSQGQAQSLPERYHSASHLSHVPREPWVRTVAPNDRGLASHKDE